MMSSTTLSFKSIGLLLCAGLVIIGVGIVSSNFHIHAQATESLQSWEDYKFGPKRKGELIGTLQLYLGDESLSHAFEEFQQHDDDEHLHHIERSIVAARVALSEYADMPMDPVESAALDDIESVLEQFSTAVASFESHAQTDSRLHGQEEAAEISDAAAARALDVLKARMSEELATTETELEDHLVAINRITSPHCTQV